MTNNDEAVAELKSLMDSMTFKVHRTRGGSLAVVFSDAGKGDKPVIGAYFTGAEWIACQWDNSGMYADAPKKLDLVLVNDSKELA